MLLAIEVLALHKAFGWINSYPSDAWSLQKADAHGSSSSFRSGLCICGMWRHCSSLAVPPRSGSVSCLLTLHVTSCRQRLYAQLFLPILSGRKDQSAIATCMQDQLQTMLEAGEAGHSVFCHVFHRISPVSKLLPLTENRVGSVTPLDPGNCTGLENDRQQLLPHQSFH